jgi:ABC-type sugar transport system ATPase subunit
MAWLRVENIEKKIGKQTIVQSANFKQEQQKKIAIAGATGSGKTTLLKIIAGLVQPTSGVVFFEDKKVLGPNDKLLPGAKGIAYLSQHFELRNNYYVNELLEMNNQMQVSEASNIYKVCRIEHLLQRKSNELSGGEKQRIALALLLTTTPKLLLLDEPFSNLDMVHKSIMKQVIDAVGKQLDITCMMISHDAADILSWADWILIMQDGELIQQGTPEQVYHQPINSYAAGLLGEYNLIDASNAAGFSRMDIHNVEAKQMLLRPEQIKIMPASNIFQKDTIQKITFWGSYYTIDVLVNEQVIRAKTLHNSYNEGERVFLSVDTTAIWYV